MFPYLMKIINLFQDDVTGDGTTSTVLLIGEFLKQADVYISEGLHPRVVTEGFEVAKNKALEVLETLRVNITPEEKRNILVQVAKTSLNTKVHHKVTFFLPTILNL
jgi:T-complex protein 1 subunit zeta